MTENEVQKNVEANDPSPSDYQDLNLVDLQVLADYVMLNSIPKDLTISESQEVVRIYMDFLNLSLHNLNLLRNLAGESNLPIPQSVREETQDV